MSWLTTNIKNRLQNPNCDFEVYINKTSFEKISFEQASDSVALSIADEKIFVGFSGGYDSEFIIRCLHKNKIPFTPVLIDLEGLEVERSYAHKVLKELKIEATILKLSVPDFLSTYYEKIYKTINGTAWPSAQYLACEYASNNNGIFVDGGHILGDGDDLVSSQNFYLPEWDFYCHALFPNTKICNFFIHTAQIAYSTLSAIEDSDLTWADYKERVYKIRYRAKVRPQTSFQTNVRELLKKLDKHRAYTPKQKVYFGDKKTLMSLISS